ncbi:hypothetical protein RCH11_001163 [Glaciihabitans sp. GrIS 2.15]|nr:hypothetical protein [Glaciihabitans sp. GrIS 2.15]
MAAPWNTQLNSLTTRADLVEQYGGSRYSGGIVPALASNNVFLFSDPSAGVKYGYNFDGPGEDESYFYTAQGTLGDHAETGNNGAVLGHVAASRDLRLFVADGYVGKSKTKLQRYIGQFRVDPMGPASWQTAPDSSGEVRQVLIFHLLPVGETALKESDQEGGASPALSVARMVPPEVDDSIFYETSGSEPTTASRLESGLLESFRAWLGHPSYAVKRWAIRVPGARSPLLSDIYDTTTKTLYEAKSSPARSDVRMAIGQLLDYQRHIPISKLACSLLLPSRPIDDLVDLAHFAQMGVTFRQRDGSFENLPI